MIDFGAHQVISGLVKLVDKITLRYYRGIAFKLMDSKMEWLAMTVKCLFQTY